MKKARHYNVKEKRGKNKQKKKKTEYSVRYVPRRGAPRLESHADGGQSFCGLLIGVELSFHGRAVAKLAYLAQNNKNKKIQRCSRFPAFYFKAL